MGKAEQINYLTLKFSVLLTYIVWYLLSRFRASLTQSKSARDLHSSSSHAVEVCLCKRLSLLTVNFRERFA